MKRIVLLLIVFASYFKYWSGVMVCKITRISFFLLQTLHQFQTESVQRMQLSRLEQKLANYKSGSSASNKKKLEEEVMKQREEVVKSVRHCTWYKVCAVQQMAPACHKGQATLVSAIKCYHPAWVG